MNFIRKSTETYGKAKLLLRENEYYIESESKAVATRLLREPAIKVRATRLSNYIHIDARGLVPFSDGHVCFVRRQGCRMRRWGTRTSLKARPHRR